jgi:hypothetical protein
MKIIFLAVFWASLCCIVIPIYGQASRENSKANKTKPANSQPLKIGSVDVDTVNVTKLNTQQQEKPTGKPDNDKQEAKSYVSRLVSAEALPNTLLCLIAFGALIAAVVTLRHIARQADYTKDQIRHLINSERAWIQIPEIILEKQLSAVVPELDQLHVWLHPYIVNNGRTQARIKKIMATTLILNRVEGQVGPRPPVLPEIPDYGRMSTVFRRTIILSPENGINWINVPLSVDDLESIKTRQTYLYIYGQMDYLDMSDTERYTRFCQIYWIPYGAGDPVFREGFNVSAVIPSAYTECT